MSTGTDEAAASSSRNSAYVAPASSSSLSQVHDVSINSVADDTASSIAFRNGVTNPGSPGSEADSTINSTTFAPSILASRLGRNVYSSTGAAASSLSLSGSGFNSPSLSLTGFNAVSTVLNNPSKRLHPIDPKSSRFPPVTPNHVPADIPKVKKAELDPYLSSVRPEWDRFMRNQSMGRQGKATIEQQQQQQQGRSSTTDSSYDSEPLGKANRRHRPTASMASLSADLQAVPPPQARKRLPNLSAVPQVFFSEEFDLGNPYTFDQVTERYKVAASSPSEQNGNAAPTYDIALNQMLQEKLSYYSDVIEQHLIIEIGQQSSSFFAALENLNDLNAEAESCLHKIDALKSELEIIDEKQAKKGLRVIREQQHRRQLECKQLAVQNVRQVIERRDLVRLLLQQGETEEALELLNKLRSALRRNDNDQDETSTDATIIPKATSDSASTDTRVVLSDLQCLASIPAQLEEMEQTLAGMLEQDLIAILKQDIDSRLVTYRQPGASSSSTSIDYFNKAGDEPGNRGAAAGNLSLAPNAAASASPLTPSIPPASPFGHSARTLSPAHSDLAARIAPLVVGLAKTGGIEKVIASYREVAIQAVQETWRDTLSSPSTEMAETVRWLLSADLSKYDDHENLPAPAARIRDLEHARFLEIGRELFEILIECLRAIDVQCKLVPRVLDQLHSSNNTSDAKTASESGNGGDLAANGNSMSTSTLPAPPTMPQGVPTNMPAKLSEVVVASAEQAHTLCARLLALRATTHATLELPPFLVIFQLCWGFVLSSEQLCRKMIVGLRGTVLSQAKGFLANFHRRRIERAAKAVEEETWAQAEVGAEIQSQIRQIVSSAVEDPADFVVTGSETQSNSNSDKEQASVEADERDSTAGTQSAKTLDIEDRQYFVVDASLDVLSLLVDYLKVIINLPLLTTEAMARVVEFLKQFNSRTCQVVLGAGAMRSAGLKNITAKHLALASQSLSIMISLIPYIRETVRRHLSPKQAVMLTEFDKLRRDFQEHQYEIHAKLVAIMSDRLTVHCRTLSAIDWNAVKPSTEATEGEDAKEAEPNKYAADLVKETATLHKVLSKYLQAVVVEHVIGQVLRAIDARLAQEFEKIPVQNQVVLDQMQTDVRYLGSKLSTLKHVEWKDEALQQILSTKRVAPLPPTVNVTTSAGSSTPSHEAAPGSPAGDKPSTSQFGPVTYKPRIPNIFARRQQQQQQQQQSQSNSPRASTDVQGTSTPSEAQRSVETTPRTSIQLSQQPASSQGVEGELPKPPDTPGPEPPAKPQAPGARSLEEEANDIPPTPPSKNQEVEANPIVKDKDVEDEDLVAPVVPAPEAVATVLAEGGRASTDLPSETTANNAAAASTDAAESTAEARQPIDLDKPEQDGSTAANSAALGVSSDAAAASDSPEAAQPTAASQANANASTNASAMESTAPPQPSTPTKHSRPVDASSNQQAATGNAGESSPARSGASTPATVTPLGTPAKPGRMSLKERLAEAARKRAQASAPVRPSSQAEAPANTATAESTVSEASVPKQKTDDPAQSGPTAELASQAAVTEAATAPKDENAAETEEEVKDAPAAKEAVSAKDEQKEASQTTSQPVEDAPVDDDKPKEASTGTSVPESVAADDTEKSSQPAESTTGDKEVRSEKVATDSVLADAPAAGAASDEATAKGNTDTADAQATKAEEAKAEATSAAGKDNEAPTQASAEAVPKDNADTKGDQDEEGDDADANEDTNDSAVGNTAGSGSKKNKKKKGKKK
ncbi:hypothetical protein NDA16_002058 [Ustilago loliicola]|nr:hypothetical protein NDA16_002058 [Ustilago loliicola]